MTLDSLRLACYRGTSGTMLAKGGHMKILEVGEHLIIDPRVCHGKLTFRGTRLPVQTVLTTLGKKRRSIDYVLKSWPHLKREAIEEAICLAAAAWAELLEDEVAEAIQELAASLKHGKRARRPYEPTYPGRTA